MATTIQVGPTHTNTTIKNALSYIETHQIGLNQYITGDVIISVDAGTYTLGEISNLSRVYKLTITGSDKDTCIIQGGITHSVQEFSGYDADAGEPTYTTGDNMVLTIENFTIEGHITHGNTTGIEVGEGARCYATNITIQNFTTGLHITGNYVGKTNSIKDCSTAVIGEKNAIVLLPQVVITNTIIPTQLRKNTGIEAKGAFLHAFGATIDHVNIGIYASDSAFADIGIGTMSSSFASELGETNASNTTTISDCNIATKANNSLLWMAWLTKNELDEDVIQKVTTHDPIIIIDNADQAILAENKASVFAQSTNFNNIAGKTFTATDIPPESNEPDETGELPTPSGSSIFTPLAVNSNNAAIDPYSLVTDG